MNRNVTIRMDEDLLRALRHRAVDEQMSLSRWVVWTLRKTLESDALREQVRDRALTRLEKGFDLGGKPLSREASHAR